MSTVEKEARRRLLGRRASLQALGSGGERDAHELEAIDAALARLDSGAWGSCLRCQGAIGRDRLRALPEAPLCLDCEGSVLPGKSLAAISAQG